MLHGILPNLFGVTDLVGSTASSVRLGHGAYEAARRSLITIPGIVTPLPACGPAGGSVAKGMKKISYCGYRFPPEIIQQAIWLISGSH